MILLGQIKDVCDVCTTGFYPATKKKVMTYAEKQIKLELVILSRVSQTQEDKYCMFPYIYGINT